MIKRPQQKNLRRLTGVGESNAKWIQKLSFKKKMWTAGRSDKTSFQRIMILRTWPVVSERSQ